MSPMLRSAAFVLSQFTASFGVIILISQVASPEARGGFFAAQAVILTITSAFGQTLIVRHFQGESAYIPLALISAFVAALALIFWVGFRTLLSATDVLFFALSVPMLVAGSLGFARMQQATTGGYWPIGISVLRLVICAAALFLSAPVSLAFALNAAIFSGSIFLSTAPLSKSHSKLGLMLYMLLFFGLLGFTFQWDRLLLAAQDRSEMIIMSGVTLLWSLPAVSVLFATLTRANAGSVFAALPNGSAPLKSKTALHFSLGLLLYTGFLMLLWTPLNALFFPFFHGSRWLALMLIAAIYFDRIGLLALYQSRVSLQRAALLKAIPIGAAIWAASFTEPALLGLYGYYLATSILFACGVWWRR